MEKTDFLTRLSAIATCTEEERQGMIDALAADASGDYDRIATLTADVDTLTADNHALLDDNEKLRGANMQLRLRIGSTRNDATHTKNETGVSTEPETKRSFADLFNDKGGIK